MTSILSSFYTKSATATSDLPFSVEDDSTVILTSINIHCFTNDAKYGNGAIIDGVIRANAVVWFDAPCKVADVMFKNYTAGSNCTITITGTQKIK
jgi:hypothetical protein